MADLPIIRLIGGDQFRKFCVICIVILIATVWMTCACHHEEGRPRTQRTQGYLSIFRQLYLLRKFRQKQYARRFEQHFQCLDSPSKTYSEGLLRTIICVYGLVSISDPFSPSRTHLTKGFRSCSIRMLNLLPCSLGHSHRSICRTTYMGQIMAYELKKEPPPELATRTGEFAMLIYSVGLFVFWPYCC